MVDGHSWTSELWTGFGGGIPVLQVEMLYARTLLSRSELQVSACTLLDPVRLPSRIRCLTSDMPPIHCYTVATDQKSSTKHLG
eukprot:2365790-Amphidinium_carterae.1